jgi:hypothetical protein
MIISAQENGHKVEEMGKRSRHCRSGVLGPGFNSPGGPEGETRHRLARLGTEKADSLGGGKHTAAHPRKRPTAAVAS